MSEARTAILARIRAANRDHEQDDLMPDIDTWLQQHSKGPQPSLNREQVVARFIDKVTQSGATLRPVMTAGEIVMQVERFCVQHALAGRLVTASTSLLNTLQWPDDWSVTQRAARHEDRLAVSEAFCAIAETGSLVLRSGSATPTTLNFLPEYFICLVRETMVVNWPEEVWELLRREGAMPRAINFITGPSRTADVEQTIQIGAHGPRHVHVLLLTR